MARTITEISNSMIDDVQKNEHLKNILTSDSKTAVWRNIIYIVAVAVWMVETLFDKHSTEVSNTLATMRPHNRYWYSQKARAFQYGYNLVQDTDYYQVTDEEAQIIQQAAVTEVNGTLFIKVAKLNNGMLDKLEPEELTQFTQYMELIKDAGVKLIIISNDGDSMRLTINIWYNPLVLDNNGKLINNSSCEPVKDTIINFIQNLPFNGEFIPSLMVDEIQKAQGVDIAEIQSCETKYGTNNYTIVQGKVIPNAGYLNIAPNDEQSQGLIINYIANV